MSRLTRVDEFGNADIIGMDDETWQMALGFDDLNRVTEALNKLCCYEDSEENKGVCAVLTLDAEGWIRTAERRPVQEDAGKAGQVLAVKGSGKDAHVSVVKWSYCTPRAYPCWMPFPKAPESLREA